MKSDRSRKSKAWAGALALALFVLAPWLAEAGFTKTQAIGTGGRKTLVDKTIYTIDDTEISATAGLGLSAYTVNANSTVVIYIPAGKTLTLKGGAASGTSGAGAGIEVPSSSTLIITGAGTLNASGGAGGGGANGENGQNADVDCDEDRGRSGYGGAGGAGGGGGAAGIGGNGGAGGAGGAKCSGDASQYKKTAHGDYDKNAINGNNGSGGGAGRFARRAALFSSRYAPASAPQKNSEMFGVE